MKQMLIILALCLPLAAFAGKRELVMIPKGDVVDFQVEITTDVPQFLKGATITVKMKDGKEVAFPAEQFKVVPRKQQIFIAHLAKTMISQVFPREVKKNRVSLLGGHGTKPGLDISTSGSVVSVQSRTGVIMGVQYQRLLTESFSMGVQLQSNNSVLLNAGFDF